MKVERSQANVESNFEALTVGRFQENSFEMEYQEKRDILKNFVGFFPHVVFLRTLKLFSLVKLFRLYFPGNYLMELFVNFFVFDVYFAEKFLPFLQILK